jgi:hypothetical protein
MMGEPQQQGPVRFTPDELKELIDSGELTYADIMKMHPDDHKVAKELYIQSHNKDAESAINLLAGGQATSMIPGIGGLAKKGLEMAVPYGKMAGQSLAALAGYEAGSWGLKKLGLPNSISEMLPLMFMMQHGGKGAAAAAPAEAASVEEALIKQGINPRNAGMAARGEKFPNPGKPVAPRAPAPVPPLVNGGEQALDVEKRIFGPQGGEAATFGVRPPPYPPNVKTGASMDDIMEMLTGSSHGQGTAEGTPIIYNPAEKATRNANDRLKKKTARRTPK